VEILDFIRNTTKQLNQRKGGVTMKRILLITLFALLSVATFYGLADATLCSTCHTMHNSQDGTPFDTDGANERLLKADCVACHTAATEQTSSFSAPAVLHTTDPVTQGGTKTNAGGDFYWVNVGPANDELGHNVIDLPGVTGQDSNINDLTPPGWEPTATSSFTYGQVAGGDSSWTSQLTCAGIYGCHGNHTDASSLAAIGGTHHNNGGSVPGGAYGVADGSTLGNSYRFLGDIVGGEEGDWNWGETTSKHNEYLGNADTSERDDDGSPEYTDKTTISFLCAECHGVFHSSILPDGETAAPWVRHPTDIVLPSTGEYGSYNPDVGGGGTYSLEVPVARGTIPASAQSTVVEGDAAGGTGAIVMCLSCHRAHGSPEPDMLRFTYNMDSGTGTADTGCFICHSQKNAD
jgi:predicted CXXCH cytochrome family protein